jgi:acetyl esterase/lipase
MLRGTLLVDATLAAAASLLTIMPLPLPRIVYWPVGMVVPEIGLWLALLPVAFAAAAWWLRPRDRRPILTAATIVLCAIALPLFLKPAIQAWRMGHALPARLATAFGPPAAPPPPPPFSLAAAVFGRAPEPLPIETLEYAPSLLLDVYRPPGRSSPAPCVVVIHGGSWVSGNRMDDGTKRWLNDHLAARGYAVASIDYRLAPEHPWPAQREDLLAALGFLRARADRLGIDRDRFVLLGRSAGAHIATATAYALPDPRALGIRGVVSFYTPTDFRLTWTDAQQPRQLDHRLNIDWFLTGSPDSAPAVYDNASPALLVTPNAPPTLILHGRLDVNVFLHHAELLDRRLDSAGVPHALVELPRAAHAFDFVGPHTPGAQTATYAVDYFVDATTR